jgi:FMN-dependent NADH-azoreductase
MGERSISRKLTSNYAQSWLQARPDGKVVHRDLNEMQLSPVNAEWIAAAYTPESARSEQQRRALETSDSLIADLQRADELVFGVPMHNFTIPSTLKLWIDQVVRVGKTFAYSANGPTGLLSGKKATLLIASGGVYEQGTQMASLNFVDPYLRTVFGFIGITDLSIISAGGTSALSAGKIDPQTFIAPSLVKVSSLAAL